MQLVCPRCSARNRVPAERLHEGPPCGGCGEGLMPETPIELDDARLPAYLQGSDLPVVVDFWASWCGPCKMMAPFFQEAARSLSEVRFVKIDTDANPRAAAQYQIRSIPTLILFQGGKEVARQSGVMNAQQLRQWLTAAH